MFFEDFKAIVTETGNKLKDFRFSEYSPEEAIQMVLDCETALFRARIKLEREFNRK